MVDITGDGGLIYAWVPGGNAKKSSKERSDEEEQEDQSKRLKDNCLPSG